MRTTSNKSKRSTASKLTFTAIFAALICVSTFMIKIPVPATQGYIHFGDIFVMLSGIFCGPGYGLLAAGTGSGLADLFSGYVIYAPVTFVIKAVGCIAVSYIFRSFVKRAGNTTSGRRKGISYSHQAETSGSPAAAIIISGIAFTAILVGGYYLFEVILYGQAALLEIPMNALQGGFATAGACGLYSIFSRITDLS